MKNTLKRLTLVLPLMAGLASAGEPAAEVAAWNAQVLRDTLTSMPEGDKVRGKQLHSEAMCASCHGADGLSPTRNFSHLAGQRAAYTYKMLIDYRDHRRNEGTGQADAMIAAMQGLTDQDFADLAVYYAGLPLPPARDAVVPADAEKLARHGDPSRLITACASCHGANGEGGANESPALAGQVPDYFVRTMMAYRSGARNNDVYDVMGIFARQLTEEEIDGLANYYAALGAR